MKINANLVRSGNILEVNGKLWSVIKTQHVQPGKGGAYIQVEMKSINNDTKINERFRSSETVEKVFLEEIICKFLYSDLNSYIFMNENTYEQISLNKEILNDKTYYLKSNMSVKLIVYKSLIISIQLPESVIFTVIQADPVVKGQTVSSSFKSAIIENKMKVMVPTYIECGMKILINTNDGSFIEKVKEVKE